MVRRAAMLILVTVAIGSLGARRSGAQVTSDAGASILFFPVVIADQEHDTLIEIANRSTRLTYARCTYTLGGAGGGSAETTFDLVLSARQTTHWVASRGRLVDPTDPVCDRVTPVVDCDGAGLDPGRIPPAPADFRGDLVCVELDRSRAATSANALRGVATLTDASADVAKYAAVGLTGLPVNDADETLCIGGASRETCARGAEYLACPDSWLVGLRADGVAQGPETDSPTLRNTLFIATCSRRAGSGGATVQVLLFNEFEQRLSTSMSVQRWAEIDLADQGIFKRAVAGSDFIQTQLHATSDGSGIVVVALTDRVSAQGDTAGGAVAAVPHPEGARAGPDRIVLDSE